MTDDIDTPEDGLPPLATAPEPSRPIRAKRHLRLVTDANGKTDTTGTTKPPAPKGKKSNRSAPDILTGLTDKQSSFCDAVASGSSLSDAYRAAYDASGMTDKTVNEEACRLFASPKIAARMRQISEDKAQQLRMLASSDAAAAVAVFRQMMLKADTDASKIRAAELLAKAAGVFTDKVEVTDKTDRSVSEIEQAIKDKLARLGLAG